MTLENLYRGLASLILFFIVGASTAYAVPAPYGQSSFDWISTFDDEFNTLNRNVWNDHIWYETSNPTINYAVENGTLKIWPMRDASGNFFNRTLDTDGHFSQLYGFFEIEAKLPYGKGPWPAFWIFNHIGDRRPEIDIMEAYPGAGPASGWSDANLHPKAYDMTVWSDATSMAGTKMLPTPDLSAAFHKYGMKWEPTRVTFYFDGKQVYAVDVTMTDPLYLLLSLWFGSASGTPDNTTPTGKSNSYEINYVRVWRSRF
jgi:beta-glucanase (GH16 family)